MSSLTLLALLMSPIPGPATEYFLDSDLGSDDNPGTTKAQPLRSLDALAQLTLRPGDVVRLKRGCSFRGRLIFRGNGTDEAPIRITSYGDGPKPEILGSMQVTEWEQDEGAIYQTRIAPERFVGNPAVFGVYEYDGDVPKRLLRTDAIPEEPGPFFFDREQSVLYITTADGRPPSKHRIEISVVEQLVDLTGRSWIEIEGLSFLFGNCRHIVVAESHDITLRNCASLFVGLYGNPNVLIVRDSTRVQLLDCLLYDSTNCGVFISSGATENVVRGCTIVKCQSNDGVTCHSGGRDEQGVRQGITGDRNVIEDNVIGLCPEESIDITSGDHHTIRGNICYGNGNPGIIVGHDSDHILIENNICFGNARSGIHIAGKAEEGARGDNRVVRNLVYDNGYPGLEIQAPYTQVYNNTVVDSRERVAVRINEASAGTILHNNLFITLDPAIPHASLHFIGCTPASLGAQLSHNLFFHAGRNEGDPLIVTDDGSFTLDSFLSEYGRGEDSLVADPRLRGIDERLYLLSRDSAAIDAGVDVGLPFDGAAPDLGWKELGREDEAPRYPRFLVDGTADEPRILDLWRSGH